VVACTMFVFIVVVWPLHGVKSPASITPAGLA
jgi:hypothetical protein